MLKTLIARPPLLAAAAAAAALAVAYISQYGFGLTPCEMCYWQRWPYMALIGLGALSLMIKGRERLFMMLALLTTVIEIAVAAFHAGVEKKWWEGPTACTGSIADLKGADLLKHIMEAPLVRCDQPAFDILGITFAGANVLYAAALFITLALLWRRA